MLNRLKSFLTPPVYADEQKTQNARHLNNFLIFLITVLTLQWFARLSTDPIVSENMIIIAGLAILSAALLIMLRRGHVQLSIYILIMTSWLAMSLLSWLNDGVNDTAFLVYVVIILAAGLLAGWRFAFLVTGLSIAAGWGFVYGEATGLIVPYAPPASSKMIDITVIFALSGFLLYLLMDGLQRALQEARESNRSLQSLSDEMEARVEERTRDLALAAEIGRRVTRVHDLDKLLTESVQLIQERFKLYHVQIYLVDAAGQNLFLHASTGEAGRQLLNRGHRLPIRFGSTNGKAAFNKMPVLVPDTKTDPIFRPNTLLPHTRSEMAVPLLTGDRVLGVLDLQSDQPNALSEENLPVYDSLAGQLAVTIDNAHLLRQIEQAQAELRQYVELSIHQGWGDYLDGIERKERIGVRYDLQSLEAYDGPITAVAGNQVLQVPITVADMPIGTVQREAEEGQEWTEDTRVLATAVARQVGQQAENLRLLSETNQYRAEAEQAARRLSGKVWHDYLDEQLSVGTGFIYDRQQVKPLMDGEETDVNGRNSEMIHQPLEVQGESFGELIVDGAADSQTKALVATVAERLSGHLDNLRLSAQTEKALAETAEQSRRLALLNDISRDLSAINSADEIFAALSQYMNLIVPHDQLTLILLKPGGKNIDVMAIVEGRAVPILENQSIAGTLVSEAMKQQQIMYLADVNEYDYPDCKAMAEQGVRSSLIAPLITARGVLGMIDLDSHKVNGFDAQDESLLQQAASLLASTFESQNLFAEAQKQAAKERLVNLVSQKIQNTVTIESALETTITELGKALQARYTKAELSLVKETIQDS